MKIGIVSDSHGETATLCRALRIFESHEVGAIVHCGDVGNTDCVEALASAGPEVYLVAGNMDRRVEELASVADGLGIHFSWEVIEVPLPDGRSLVATHGSDERILGELIHDHQFPYVCHGHTHRTRNERINGVRIINPGALSHAKVRTVAVLDTDADTVEHILVP
ncbi:MAG TPA: metallophosphoesterase family protein [Phycisphaerae bacterium]|nr:metallophosphoesterase family protein [Phycisphaerae bacterium]